MKQYFQFELPKYERLMVWATPLAGFPSPSWFYRVHPEVFVLESTETVFDRCVERGIFEQDLVRSGGMKYYGWGLTPLGEMYHYDLSKDPVWVKRWGHIEGSGWNDSDL